jgi:O-antigen/teichoic acid export membrane protein
VVGVGLAINGLTYYAFLAVARRALDDAGFDAIAVLWAVMIVIGPGLFQPLEQEVGRALARRRARGVGAGPLVHRVATLGGLLLAGAVAVIVIFHEVLLDRLFDEEPLMLLALVLALAGFCAGHLVRGTLSGNGRFAPYARFFAAEGILRLAGGVTLAVASVTLAGAYGLAMGAAPLLAAGVALIGQRHLTRPGPDAHWSELSEALGYLLVGSMLTGLMLNIGPLAVHVLAPEGDVGAAGRFYAGLAIARLPLFFFQAIQASLLPMLAGYAGAHDYPEFRRALGRLLALVTGVTVLTVVGASVLGPFITERVLQYDLSTADMALMALSMGLFMITISLDQSLLALHGHRRMATGWVVTVLAFGVFLWVERDSDLFSRVEWALVGAGVAGVIAMGTFLVGALRRAERSTEAPSSQPAPS